MTTTRAQSDGEGLVTLTDVAVLARVRRPVVTVWRGRPHPAAGAFPAPVAQVDGVDRFDRAAVVDWLAASGRGNNPDIALDAALHARPPLPTPDGRALVTALLALRARTGEILADLDVEDIGDLADDVDPDDRFLHTEVATAREVDVYAAAEYVDALVDAALGPADALTHLDRDPSRFGLGPDLTAASAPVLDLLGHLVGALGAGGGLPIADPTGCGHRGVLAAVQAVGGQTWADVRMRPVVTADTASVRWAVREAWRTLVIHGIDPAPIDTDDEGHVDVRGPAVVLAAYPHPGAPAVTPERLLDMVDDVLVQLDDDQPAVILGPASVLTDALGNVRAGRTRRQILDTGRLRALVRLGAGSSAAVPQRRLALWVVGPTPDGNFRGEGRTAVADLDGVDLAEVRDDLMADVVAAIEDRPLPAQAGVDESQGRAHVFRVARYQRTFSVLARSGDLVPRDLRAASPTPGRASAGASAAEAVALAARTRQPVAATDVDVAIPPAAVAQGRVATVRELLAAGRVRIVQGTRLVEGEWSAASVGGGVPVVGVAELGGEARPGDRVVDLLTFTAAHPRAHRTEAGDVVFCPGPRPGAWVDVRGGSVVEYPARALRVVPDDDAPDRVIPRILAADLVAGRGRQWRSFRARLVPVVTADTLTEVLESIAVAREDAQRRVDDLDRLTQLLADGACAGVITAMMNSDEPEGHPRATSHQEDR